VNLKGYAEQPSSADISIDLRRLNHMLQAAHRSSIDIKNAYDFYTLAWKELNKDNLTDAYLYCDRSKYELTSSLNDAKVSLHGLKFHSPRTLSYFFKLYGLYAILFGIASTLLFSYLIYMYAGLSILDVPLWSAFFAGLGASTQILTGVVDDLRREGMTVRYKRVWYTTVPLLSLIFGYMAYLLFSSGLVAFNINSQSRTFSTMFLCFLTGFLTSWIIYRLSQLSRDIR
jgi:hypothetical protein